MENARGGLSSKRCEERGKDSEGKFQIKPIIGQGDDNPGALELFLTPNRVDLLSWQII